MTYAFGSTVQWSGHGWQPSDRTPRKVPWPLGAYGRELAWMRSDRTGQIYRGASQMSVVKGTIKRLVSDKGFGFVAAQDGTEYFFHRSACTGVRFDELREGQSVSFEK